MSKVNFANVVSDTMVLVVNTETGEDVKFFNTDVQFADAVELVKNGDYADVFNLDIKTVVTSFFAKKSDNGFASISIDAGVGYIILHKFGDMKVELSSAITNKIVKMNSQGFSCAPLANFLSNLYQNPSPSAIAELYLFIEACDLPITEDGCFIAYKMVKADYMDIYTGTIRNKIGDAPSMPRGLVDDNCNNTCSRGLHFCSKNYLTAYGSSSRSSDHCMLVKINPADVVSIPSDYNNAKGRAWLYEVVGEANAGWRDTLPKKDYTDAAVVAGDGGFYDEDESDYDDYDYDEDEFDLDECDISAEAFITGYKTGFTHGKSKLNKMAVPSNNQYSLGYDEGYKDGKNKKANKHK